MKELENDPMAEMLQVYFIMGSVNCQKDPVDVLKEAIAGGITIFQYREKGNGALEGQEKLELAKKLRGICSDSKIPFIVNDDIDLALAVNADGVHIGQEDDSVEVVRKKIGDRILGVSVHDLTEAEHAIRFGVDYFGVGPVYPTSTKTDTKAVQGVTFLNKLRARGYKTPIVGIGGITSENASNVTKAGADGVSVITAITNAVDIEEAVRRLKTSVLVGMQR